MINYFIQFTEKYAKSQNRVMNNVLWYDIENNKMHVFLGDKLRFEWDPYKKKIVPAVEWSDDYNCYIMKEAVYENYYKKINNRQEIEDWIENIGKRFGIEINESESDDKGIMIEVDETASDQVEYAMERYGLDFSEENND